MKSWRHIAKTIIFLSSKKENNCTCDCFLFLSLKNSLEVLLGGVDEFCESYSTQEGDLAIDILYWSGALVGLDKELREWGGAQCGDALRGAECALAK